jgi:hypothetical protein
MYVNGRGPVADTGPVVPDLLLGVLFIVAFARTRAPARKSTVSSSEPATF